jgi:hypothetical protein
MLRKFLKDFIIRFKEKNSLVIKCSLISLPIIVICLIDSFNSEILKALYTPVGLLCLVLGLWWIRNAFKY